MKEPNLGGMLDFLSDLGNEYKKSSTNSIFDVLTKNGRDVSKEIVQIIYYCSDERAETVENEILQISDDEKRINIFSALVSLYPLTRNIVVQMIKKAYVKPSDFLDLFDNNSELLKMIKDNIELIKNSSQSSNIDVITYSRQINTLQDEIVELEKTRGELESSIEGYRQKCDEKKQLNKDIEELRRIKDLGIDKEIDALKIEKQRLENEKLEKEHNKEELGKNIQELKVELQQVSDNTTKIYQEALNNLQKCIAEIVK